MTPDPSQDTANQPTSLGQGVSRSASSGHVRPRADRVVRWLEPAFVRILLGCLVVVPLSLLVGYLLGTGGMRGHDARFHLVSTGLLNEALWQHGLWFPRWAAGADHGFGAPLTLFYQPLSHWVAAVPLPDGGHWRLMGVRLGIAMVLGLGLSVLTCFLWLRLWAPRQAALIGALVYLALPYHAALNTLHRQALAEVWGMALYPLVAWAAERLLRSKTPWGWPVVWLATAVALALLSHVATAILVLPILCGLAGLLALIYARDRLLPLIVGCAGGIALSAFYWVPALMLAAEAPLQAGLYDDIQAWTKAEYYLGGRLLAHFDPKAVGISDLVKLAAVLSLLLPCLVLVWLRGRGLEVARLRLWLIAGVLAVALLSVAAYPLWLHAPGLWRVQIPFRVMVLLCLAVAPAAAWLWMRRRAGADRPSRRLFALMVLVAPLVLTVGLITPRIVLQQVSEEPWRQAAETVPQALAGWPVRPEYQIVQSSPLRTQFLETGAQVLVVDGQADVSDVESAPDGGLALTATVSQGPARLALRRAAFPGWRVLDAAGLPMALEEEGGLLHLTLAPGDHALQLSRHWVAPMRWGLWLSLAAAAGLLVLAAAGRRRAVASSAEG